MGNPYTGYDNVDAMRKAAWESSNKDINMYKLLMETANQESHFGKLDPANPMQQTPIFLKEMKRLGMSGNPSDLGDAFRMAAQYYRKKMKGEDLSTPGNRANVWKQYYNTVDGAGTPQKYLNTNKIMDWSAVDQWYKQQGGVK